MNPNEAVANLLAEVKLAERRLEKANEKLAPLPDRIKAALRAGDRPAAERLARAYEDAKAEVTKHEGEVREARDAYASGKKRMADLARTARSAQQTNALLGSLQAFEAANATVNAAEEMLKKLEEETAMADARLEVALGDLPAPDEPPPPRSPEDILKELEGP